MKPPQLPEPILTYLDKQLPEPRAIALAVAERLHALAPNLDVKLAWGFPCWVGQERVVSVMAREDRCNLQLWSGARLAHLSSRIEGTGKDLRHVKLRSLSEIDDEVDAILEAAIALDAQDPKRVR